MENNNKKALEFFATQIKNGDENAFKIIFDTYYHRLYMFALHYVSELYVAEEIVETVLLKLWQKKHQLGSIGNLKSYLYSMVRNASLDYLKKEKKFVKLEVGKHDSLILMEQYIIEEETHAILFKALEALPEKCKQVFKLSCLEGLKYQDIAEELQISVNTVKSQRARAIELMKKNLKYYFY